MATRRNLRAVTARRTPSSPAPLYRGIELSVPQDTVLPGALCREVAGDAFFPDADDTEGVALAKSICGHCPVQALCLARALERDERIGIWGGTTPAERDALLGRSRRCGTPAGYAAHYYYGELPCADCRKVKTAADTASRAVRAAQALAAGVSRRPPGPRIPMPTFSPYQRPKADRVNAVRPGAAAS